MKLTAAQLGFIRSVGSIAIFAILNYVGDASHLNGIVSAGSAALVAGLALSLEHYIEASTGSALFGTTTVR